MLTRMTFCGLMCLLAVAATADEFAEQRERNWHQWRGPLATGVAPLGDPPTEWSESKNIRWKVAIPGQGSASPIVWGNRIFVLTAVKTDKSADNAESTASLPSGQVPARTVGQTGADVLQLAQRSDRQGGERGRGNPGRGGFGGRGGNLFNIAKPTQVHQFVVLCLDRQTGKSIWQRTAAELVPHEGHHETASFASASPITDGRHVWASFGSRGIYCYDLDGNLKWDVDLGDMQTRFSFGEGSSPALHGNTLVVLWDHEGDDFIVALDAATGDEKWRRPREEPSTWSTPLVVESGGRTQVVTSGSNRIRSYDLETGELLWECGGLGTNPIATPVTYDGLAIAMSGHNAAAGIAVPLTARGDVTGSDTIAWRLEEVTPYVSSPILYDDLLYFVKGRNAIFSCVEAGTGAMVINQKRLPEQDTIYASPVGAAGRIYVSSREGLTVVLRQGREFDVLARNALDETIDASPAIVGDELILRGAKHLYCIAEE